MHRYHYRIKITLRLIYLSINDGTDGNANAAAYVEGAEDGLVYGYRVDRGGDWYSAGVDQRHIVRRRRVRLEVLQQSAEEHRCAEPGTRGSARVQLFIRIFGDCTFVGVYAGGVAVKIVFDWCSEAFFRVDDEMTV